MFKMLHISRTILFQHPLHSVLHPKKFFEKKNCIGVKSYEIRGFQNVCFWHESYGWGWGWKETKYTIDI